MQWSPRKERFHLGMESWSTVYTEAQVRAGPGKAN